MPSSWYAAAVIDLDVRRGKREGRWLLGGLVALGFVAMSAEARADASSWFSLAGGAARSTQAGADPRYPGLMQLELGLGSSSGSPFVVGGIAKAIAYFGNGTDLAVGMRGATGGFVRGGFGFALDAGGYERWWGDHSAGFLGALVLGAPLGLQLTATTELGTNDVRTFTAALGIDFLRLTVYRQGTGGFWPNPILSPPSQASR